MVFLKTARFSHWLIGAAACGATIALYGYTFWRPALLQDDFHILAASVTWPKTWENLWLTQNEHATPAGRLLTFALIYLAGRPTNYPLATALVGPAALVVALLLTKRFVQRELGHAFYALLAMILFGVTTVYLQAVFWFAASLSVLTLDMLLLGLLAAQSYRLTRRWPHVLLSALWCFLAPCWFASGVLAGPLCCLYVLLPPRGLTWARFGAAAGPLVGTATFLAINLQRNATAIITLEHYKTRHTTTALDAFQPGKGLLMTLRSVVENLLLGVVGVTDVQVPVLLVIITLVVLTGFGVWWWRRAPCKRFLVLGLGLIGASYLLIYSARAIWSRDTSLLGVLWSRYHLQPQLGLVLFLIGGLPAWAGRRFVLREDGGLTRNQVLFLLSLIGLLLLIHWPRGFMRMMEFEPLPFASATSAVVAPDTQQAALGQVERVDARCQEHGISATTANRVLPWLAIPGAAAPGEPQEFNGWNLLRGSPAPREPETRSDEEIRRLLEK
jgi:hypothetical protein